MDSDINQNKGFIGQTIDKIVNDIFKELGQLDINSLIKCIKKYINQDNVLNSKERTNYINNIIAGNNKRTLEVKASALKKFLSIDSWKKKNTTKVCKYRTYSFIKDFIKKTFGKLLKQLVLGTRMFTKNNFGGVDVALVRELDSVIVLPTSLKGSMGYVIALPMVVGLFLGLFGIQMLQVNTNISSLVPQRENIGEEVGETPEHGEIIMLADGRVGSCGVGMDANFGRNGDFPHIPESGLGDVSSYNQQLKKYIGDQFGKRCGVVYAAQYLAYNFKYWVEYSSNGSGDYSDIGLNPNWGTKPSGDPKHPHIGLDCSGFNMWAQTNGIGEYNSGEYTGHTNFGSGDCNKIRNLIQPGDTIVLGSGPNYHIALVLEYKGDEIKFAHAGGGSGVTTGIINLCSGFGHGMTFERLNGKVYPGDNYHP